jgi:hypothetical protein
MDGEYFDRCQCNAHQRGSHGRIIRIIDLKPILTGSTDEQVLFDTSVLSRKYVNKAARV